MITRNIKENMIAEVGNELDDDDLEGRLLKNATFSGGNRHVRVAISEMKIWGAPGNSALEKSPGTEFALCIIVTLTWNRYRRLAYGNLCCSDLQLGT